jgi:hypothetical protein
LEYAIGASASHLLFAFVLSIFIKIRIAFPLEYTLGQVCGSVRARLSCLRSSIMTGHASIRSVCRAQP